MECCSEVGHTLLYFHTLANGYHIKRVITGVNEGQHGIGDGQHECDRGQEEVV